MTMVDNATRANRPQRTWITVLMMSTVLATAGFGTRALAQPQQAIDPAISVRTFSISAQSLTDGLTQFGQQSGWQVSVHGDLVRGASTHGASGTMTPEQALRYLLSDTGFTYAISDRNTVTLQRTVAQTGRSGPSVIQLGPVRVEGEAGNNVAAPDSQNAYGPGAGYVATRSAAGTKTDTPIIETPQSISVVTRQQMEDQNIQSVAQALRYSSGVVPEQRGANTDSLEYVYGRGFQIDEYLNGLILPSSVAGFNVTSFDPYLLDRVELLKGPASVLYGQASPGGILDLDSKRPTVEPLHEIMLQTGSYGRAQGAVDLSGALNGEGTWLGRLTADSFSTATQTRYIHEQRIAIAPSLTWRPDSSTSLTIFGGYQYDPEASLYNFVPAQGTVLPGISVPRNFNPGDPSYEDFSKTEASIGYAFSHRFDDTWSVFQDFRYLYNQQSIHTLEPYGLTPDGSALEREAYYNHGTVNAVTLDNRAQAKFQTAALQHTVTFGADWYRTDYDHIFEGGDAPNLSIADPQYHQAIPQPNFTFGSSGDQIIDQVGLYAQDQIRLERWAFLLGVREDFADEHSKPLTGQVADQSDTAVTWRAGLVYLFDNGFAPYFSYSTSFQPTVGTSISGAAFRPSTGQQYEVGLKYQPTGLASFVTASLFNLTEQNVLTADPNNNNFQVQTGEIRSRGIELEAHASLTNDLQIIGSYTYTDLTNTKSGTADMTIGGITESTQGKRPVGIPSQMASLWADYTLQADSVPGLSLGGGIRYLGTSYGDDVNSFKVPSATLFDLAVHYDLGKGFPTMPALNGTSASVTVSNLFDKDYISYCNGTATCTYGAGRVVLANLKYRW